MQRQLKENILIILRLTMLTLTILKLSKYNIGMSTFVARDKDLFRLESLWNKDEFNFVAVYGRRRVGKTALIREFVKNKPHLYFQATKDKQFNLVNFSASIGKTFYLFFLPILIRVLDLS